MSNRSVAPTNQWPTKTGGAAYRLARLIDDPVHAGFLTFADAGDVAAYLVDDPDHAGFVTPDDAATADDATATAMIVGGSRAIIVGT